MRGLVRAEILKVRSVRALVAFPLAAVAYAVVSFGPVLTAPAADRAAMGGDALLGALRGPGFFVAVAMLLLGVLVTAGEFRHGTMPALLTVAPRRGSVAAAKAVAVGIVAAASALAAELVSLAVGVWVVPANTVAVADLGVTVVAVVAVAVAYGLAGAGLGLALRDQTAAIGAALVWIGIVEGAVPVVLRKPWLFKWLPSGAANSVLGVADAPPDLLPAWGGALVLGGVVVVLAAAGRWVLAARDVG